MLSLVSSQAGQLQYVTIPGLENSLKEDKKPAGKTVLSEEVTAEDVAAVVARHTGAQCSQAKQPAALCRLFSPASTHSLFAHACTGIPMSKLMLGEQQKLLHLEDELHQQVVGQDNAVGAIARAIRISRAGLHAHTKPTGCFLFMGPSGVGKTELCKALSTFMFDGQMTRIDMSEYMESHSVSRLIGAPPGVFPLKQFCVF